MATTKISETRVALGDLVIREHDNLLNYEAVLISNPSAVAYADIELFGMPIGNLVRVDKDHYTADLLLTADSADVEAIVVEHYKHSFDATGGANDTVPDRVRALVRGPAVVNMDKVAADDPAGDAYNKAAIRDALPALGITPRYEPEIVEVAPGP